MKIGEIKEVKVLGILALIDSNETDWKVVTIQTTDPLSIHLKNINDIELHVPGLLNHVRRWFKYYKSAEENSTNSFGFQGEFQSRSYALRIINETHQFWKKKHMAKSNR